MIATSQLRCGLTTLALLALALCFQPATAQVLPPPPAKLTKPVKVFVREFRFEGNTVFTKAELAKVTESFTNREITSDELEEARRAVTMYYINHGYVNSGAIIPDQDLANGVILMRITEGVLSKIVVRGNK